ncbi:metallophosphoesterase [Mycobacterium intracellulare]|uniref:Metallophosphoesterase n=1 Tax=Mycobacterium intracellulare TaxID=1767 RepID=A0AAE4UAN4_MYCIT|nr:metallophosphoesterase [Mycobacterium intracellulare]MDV6975289.1 metallophosphoesterase [Mycobacterium intracellulare]MDV6980353.1 metallophosphoesterase [Mycobacterium intracellulare]MDV7010782.1 metallophosphoesterase [Mycobacterium intracellulare]MDV7025688.1 metallophosphoesterase [Mycobacterium intracellulare]
MSKRVCVISDTQMPYDDRKALKALIRYIGDTQPDEVIHIGDLMDFPQPSRWNKGTAGEFEGSVFEDCEQAKKRFLEPLREVYDGPVGVHEGNHDERARTYLAKYAPALAESGAFNIETLLDFDGFGIELLPEFNKIAPGWITTHGHRGQISMSQIGGRTAHNAAIKFDVSVVMGHTHRQGITSSSRGFGGDVNRVLVGVEVGHLMNQKLAGYLKGGTGNWQLGFALLTIEGRHVKPELVPIQGGRFTVDGEVWEV